MAIGSTTPLLEPSPAARPLAAARTAAANTAAKVATFVQSTRRIVSSAVAIRWWCSLIGNCYDWGRLRAARRLRHAIGRPSTGADTDMEILDYFKAIGRRFWVLVLVPLIAGFLPLAWFVLRPAQYAAHATVLPTSPLGGARSNQYRGPD